MKAFIDTEFNGFGGSLISMAIVCEDGREWYEVKEIPAYTKTEPWVEENVLPVLGKDAIGPEDFKKSLHRFLRSIDGTEIVADWPSDLAHFFNELLGFNHMDTLKFNCTATLDLSINYESAVPHNALEDARAIMRQHQKKAA
jgi:hypothetical protein